MNSDKDPLSSELSILDLQNRERIEKKRKYLRNYYKKRRQIPEIKERENFNKQSKKLLNALRQFDKIDPHKICKELGHSRDYGRRNQAIFIAVQYVMYRFPIKKNPVFMMKTDARVAILN